MAYLVISGEILNNGLYLVVATQSVVYNSVTYTTGQMFKGVWGVTNFTYSGSGSQIVNEVANLSGGSVEFVTSDIDMSILSDKTLLNGMAIEFSLNDAEKIVNEETKITGFAIELIDYPFYSFAITETRL